MKLSRAIDDFIADRRSQGRINSPNTELVYRGTLETFCEVVGDLDLEAIERGHVKQLLRRWSHPNTQRQKHAVLTSFGDWAMEEGYRDTNPARMVVKAKARAASIYRPTLGEVVTLMDTARGERERWVIHLGVLAGLRREELCLLQGRHLGRVGAVWVSPDIGKGGRERWVPVLAELEPVVAEIRLTIGPEQYVIARRRPANAQHTEYTPEHEAPLSGRSLYNIVRGIGRRAGLGVEIGPHTLRHAFGTHVARYAGLRAAQELMGHVNVETTASSYVDRPELGELAVSVQGFRYRREAPSVEGAALQDAHNVETRHRAPRRGGGGGTA